jgi:NAD(P)-dependent dehydrogenase (short-subunit alcohol dehydrogenase family)
MSCGIASRTMRPTAPATSTTLPQPPPRPCPPGVMTYHRDFAFTAIEESQKKEATMTGQDGRVWFITGSSSGFGRSLVDAARARGDRVVATARQPDALAGLEGEGVLVLQLDVTDEEALEPALTAAAERFGRIDVLVNSAGIGFVGALEEMRLNDLRAAMETMFFGPAALTRAVLPRMRAQGSGAIVQISSQGGRMAGPGVSAYCAAKFALEGLSEAIAGEVAPFGVRVLIVEPGNFRTGLLGRSMHMAAPMEEYASTVGVTRSYFESEDGRQLGDPRRAASAIIEALDADEPPLRLVLGADAVEGIRTKYEELSAELTRWESLARSTAFEPE